MRMKAHFQQKTKQKHAISADSAEKGTGIEQESVRPKIKGNTDLEKRVHKNHFLILDQNIYEPRHEISNNVVCATSKGSDQPAHMRSLIRAFASCLNILEY